MESRERFTPETITVYPLNMEKLNTDIDKFFHKENKNHAGITYHAMGVLAIVKQPKHCLIDDEFVGHDIDDKIIFYVYESGERAGHKWHACLPEHEVNISTTELEQYLKPATTLANFTKARRGYNSRIRANEADWIKYFNKG